LVGRAIGRALNAGKHPSFPPPQPPCVRKGVPHGQTESGGIESTPAGPARAFLLGTATMSLEVAEVFGVACIAASALQTMWRSPPCTDCATYARVGSAAELRAICCWGPKEPRLCSAKIKSAASRRALVPRENPVREEERRRRLYVWPRS